MAGDLLKNDSRIKTKSIETNIVKTENTNYNVNEKTGKYQTKEGETLQYQLAFGTNVADSGSGSVQREDGGTQDKSDRLTTIHQNLSSKASIPVHIRNITLINNSLLTETKNFKRNEVKSNITIENSANSKAENNLPENGIGDNSSYQGDEEEPGQRE